MIERSNANPQVVDLFVQRWSPRSFDGSEMPQSDLDAIFEAAGWAPSAFNLQPWRFLHARRGDAHWQQFLALLMEFNQAWAKEASAIVLVVSDTLHRKPDGSASPNHSHSFDAGAAWALAALQATAMGYHTHAMTGVKFDEAREALGVPPDHRLEAAFVIGRKAARENLPEALRAREVPSGRKPISEVAFSGRFR
jgi:nitroreductase